MDKLVPFSIPPGVYRNGTDYESKGRWFASNLIRFLDATVKPIGGWRRAQDDTGANIAALTGVPRGVIAWRGATGDPYVAIGTTSKLYVLFNGSLQDKTPVGFTAGRTDTGYGSAVSGAYGTGNYGVGAYGYGQITNTLLEATTWQLDTFGNYLVGVDTTNKKLYVWDGSAGVATSVDFSGALNAPTQADALVVTPERFLVLLGAGTAATPDNRRIIWANQEGYTVWNPLETNTAGGWNLKTQGRIMAGKASISETLIWTDIDVHRMTYIGGPLVYRFAQIGDKCGLISRRSWAMVGTKAYWMSRKGFFTYDGYVKDLPSEVQDYVFSDINKTQAAKIWATTTSEYGEVTWFYPSGSATEVDSYVTYNTRGDVWSFGKLARTAGTDVGAIQYPMLVTSDGLLYEHEIGQDHTGSVPYVESGPAEIGDGDRIMSVQTIVPDEKTQGDVNVTFYTRMYPNGSETVQGPYSLTNPAPIGVRFEARQARVRLQEAAAHDWRVGTMRFGVIQSSYR